MTFPIAILFYFGLLSGYGLYLGYLDIRKVLARKKAQDAILHYVSEFAKDEDDVEYRNNLMLCTALCLLMSLEEVQGIAAERRQDIDPDKQAGATLFQNLATAFDSDGKRWFKLKPSGQTRYITLKRKSETMIS